MIARTSFYKIQNLSQPFLFNQDKIKMEPNLYEDIHNYWSEVQGVAITKVETILNQVIWNNTISLQFKKCHLNGTDGSNMISCILKIFYQIMVTQVIKT